MRELFFEDGHGFTSTAILDSGNARLRRLEGWYGGSSVETEEVERLTDGAVPAIMRRGARRIVIGVMEYFSTRAEAVKRQREISGIFMGEDKERIGDGTLTVHNEEGTLTAYGVALDDKPRIAAYLGAMMVDWEVTLRVPDPRIYAPAQRVMISSPGIGIGLRYPLYQQGYLDYGEIIESAPALLVNEGNAIAYPTIAVQGTFPGGFKLALYGDVPAGAGVEWSGGVASRSPVTVDMLRGQVLVDNVDQSWAITRSVWGGAAAYGGNLSAKLEPLSGGGSGYAAVELRSTYM